MLCGYEKSSPIANGPTPERSGQLPEEMLEADSIALHPTGPGRDRLTRRVDPTSCGGVWAIRLVTQRARVGRPVVVWVTRLSGGTRWLRCLLP